MIQRMQRIDRNSLRAPARVLDLELSPTSQTTRGSLSVENYNSIWCLSRVGDIPAEISFWDVSHDTDVSLADLRRQLVVPTKESVWPDLQAIPRDVPSLSLTVVLCTRDRPDGVRSTLSSLQRQVDQDFNVIVVENGSNSAADVVNDLALPRCRYITEPIPGLARARNRGLSRVETDLVAWIDDDEVADPNWIYRLKEGFAHKHRPAAVCGVMLPAELEFEAQVRFEQYGGFNKGRTMEPEMLQQGTASIVSPFYPLPAFGPGGNMAFRTQDLLSVRGFDPCLGAGTRTHGGEETRVLSSLLSSGRSVLHWPAAITWHTHRREMGALQKQFYGYSAGLSAFYMSTLRSHPRVAWEIFQLAPNVLRDLRRGSDNLRSGQLPADFPPNLVRAARRGLIEGGFMYLLEAIRERRLGNSAPLPQKGALANDAST